MPTITIQKFLLITCIAAIAAAVVSVSHAEKTSILDHAVQTEAQQAAPRMCGAHRSQMTRLPVYKRYLNRTRSLPYTPRRHR